MYIITAINLNNPIDNPFCIMRMQGLTKLFMIKKGYLIERLKCYAVWACIGDFLFDGRERVDELQYKCSRCMLSHISILKQCIPSHPPKEETRSKLRSCKWALRHKSKYVQ